MTTTQSTQLQEIYDTLITNASGVKLAGENFKSVLNANSKSGTVPEDIAIGLFILCGGTVTTEHVTISFTLSKGTVLDLGNQYHYRNSDGTKCTCGFRVYYIENVPKGTTFSFSSSYMDSNCYRLYKIA